KRSAGEDHRGHDARSRGFAQAGQQQVAPRHGILFLAYAIAKRLNDALDTPVPSPVKPKRRDAQALCAQVNGEDELLAHGTALRLDACRKVLSEEALVRMPLPIRPRSEPSAMKLYPSSKYCRACSTLRTRTPAALPLRRAASATARTAARNS